MGNDKVMSKHEIMKLLRNVKDGEVYYVKVFIVDKDFNLDKKDYLITNQAFPHMLEEIEENIVVWLEKFSTINSPGEVLHALDPVDLLGKLKSVVIGDVINKLSNNKSDDNEVDDSEDKEAGVYVYDYFGPELDKNPLVKEIITGIKRIIEEDEEVHELLAMRNINFSVKGELVDNEYYLIKVSSLSRDHVLASVKIPVDSNPIIINMRLQNLRNELIDKLKGGNNG